MIVQPNDWIRIPIPRDTGTIMTAEIALTKNEHLPWKMAFIDSGNAMIRAPQGHGRYTIWLRVNGQDATKIGSVQIQ